MASSEEKAPEGKAMSLQIEPSMAQGRYATLVLANNSDDDCQLTFVAQDYMASNDENLIGHVVARVYMSNKGIRQLSEMLVKHVTKLDSSGDGAGE